MLILLFAAAGCAPSAPQRADAPARRSEPVERRGRSEAGRSQASRDEGRIVRGRFHSEALGVDKALVVWLPAGYDHAPPRRFPVIYMLHGFGGSEESWVRLGLPAAATGLGLEAIVVMADGDDAFYVNAEQGVDFDDCLRSRRPWGPVDMQTYCVRRPRYEDYVVHDLVAYVDSTWRTIADRSARGIGGLSMGGFGALVLAMRHPETFSVAVSHAGVDSLLYAGPHPYVLGRVRQLDDVATWGHRFEGIIPGIGDHVRRVLGRDLARWRAHDPATLAAGLSPGRLALYLDCGTADGFEFDDQAQHLHEILEARGIRHAFELLPGGHDGGFFASRIDEGLAFQAAHLTAAVPGS